MVWSHSRKSEAALQLCSHRIWPRGTFLQGCAELYLWFQTSPWQNKNEQFFIGCIGRSSSHDPLLTCIQTVYVGFGNGKSSQNNVSLLQTLSSKVCLRSRPLNSCKHLACHETQNTTETQDWWAGRILYQTRMRQQSSPKGIITFQMFIDWWECYTHWDATQW